MSLLLDRAKANTATTGTGTVSLGSAVSPYQTWSSAGAVSGTLYSYLIEDGVNWEIGEGTYTSGSPSTLTRSLIESSTGSLLNLSGSATVACVANKKNVPTMLVGTYTGNGATARTITLPSPVDVIFIEGYGSPIVGNSFAWAIRGLIGARINVNTSNAATFDITTPQLSVSSDGSTITVDGTGTAGLNNNGATYHYVGFKVAS